MQQVIKNITDNYSGVDTFEIKIFRILLNLFQEKIGRQLKVSGLENIQRNASIIFAPNHFTRLETIIVPYVLDKHCGIMPRSLADQDLFIGGLAKILESVKVMSVGNPNRNQTIIDELVKGQQHWLIYPEGQMQKDKEVFTGSLLNGFKSSAKTGTAVLAIQAQLELINQNIIDRDIVIIPVSITYYPIEPQPNAIYNFVKSIRKRLPHRAEEELLVEGSILENSTIDIHFSEGINVRKFISKSLNLTSKLAVLSDLRQQKIITNLTRHTLTCKIMENIYSNITISLSHILAVICNEVAKSSSGIVYDELFERVIYFALKMQDFNKSERLNLKISSELTDLSLLLSRQKFDETVNIFIKQNILTIENNILTINLTIYNEKHRLHEIRLKNLLKVFYNEAKYISKLPALAKLTLKPDLKTLSNYIAVRILEFDIARYNNSYDTFFDPVHSKLREVGQPCFLPAQNGSNNIGIVLSHGYKSTPREVYALGKYLSNRNINVYLTRFKGHGTSPQEMKDITWQEWVDYYSIGVEFMKRTATKVYLGGFSTGGLAALYTTHLLNNHIAGVVSISSALKIADIKFRLVKFAKFWSDLLIGKDDGYIEDVPEVPETNYHRNYLSSMLQLQSLMNKTQAVLPTITVPALIIQSTLDPIVDPKSADIIYQSLASTTKDKFLVQKPYHTILKGEDSEIIFEKVYQFCKK